MEAITVLICPNCKSNILIMGFETFKLNRYIFKERIIYCMCCHNFYEPVYAANQYSRTKSTYGKTMLLLTMNPLKPAEIYDTRGTTIESEYHGRSIDGLSIGKGIWA